MPMTVTAEKKIPQTVKAAEMPGTAAQRMTAQRMTAVQRVEAVLRTAGTPRTVMTGRMRIRQSGRMSLRWKTSSGMCTGWMTTKEKSYS